MGLRGLDVPSISTLLSYRAQRSYGDRSWDSMMGGINQRTHEKHLTGQHFIHI